MIERTPPRSAVARGRFTIGELHRRLDDIDVTTASTATLLDAVAGYELVRLNAVHRQRQARTRLGELGG